MCGRCSNAGHAHRDPRSGTTSTRLDMALSGGDTRRSVDSNYLRSRSTATGRGHRTIWQTFLSADITIRLSDKHIHVHNGLPAGMGGHCWHAAGGLLLPA